MISQIQRPNFLSPIASAILPNCFRFVSCLDKGTDEIQGGSKSSTFRVECKPALTCNEDCKAKLLEIT